MKVEFWVKVKGQLDIDKASVSDADIIDKIKSLSGNFINEGNIVDCSSIVPCVPIEAITSDTEIISL